MWGQSVSSVLSGRAVDWDHWDHSCWHSSSFTRPPHYICKHPGHPHHSLPCGTPRSGFRGNTNYTQEASRMAVANFSTQTWTPDTINSKISKPLVLVWELTSSWWRTAKLTLSCWVSAGQREARLGGRQIGVVNMECSVFCLQRVDGTRGGAVFWS